jgi:MFS family permease
VAQLYPSPPRGGAWRNGVVRRILAAELISALGSQMSFVALPWYVLTTTGSATRMGLVLGTELLPAALLGIPSALVVQRWGVRRTLLAANVCRGPLLAAIPALAFARQLTFPVLLTVVFLIGAFGAPYFSAQRLVLPETFADDESLVVQAIALLEGVVRMAMLLGPALAGVAIAAFGPANILYIDAATYLAAFFMLRRWLPAPRRPAAVWTEDERGLLAGARFALTHPLLGRITFVSLLFGLFFPPLLASLPVLTKLRYAADPRVAGLLYAAWGGGALLGTLTVLPAARRIASMTLGAIGAIGLTLPLWLLVVDLSRWQFALVLLVSGFFTPMLNAPVITLMMLRAPDEVRAKVITFILTMNLLAGPIAYALTGPALDRWGLRPVYVVVAIGVSLAAALMVSLAPNRVAPTPAASVDEPA